MRLKHILKVLVGSRAFRLEREDSDYDYRGVFVDSTSEMLKLNTSQIDSIERKGDDDDDTKYEIGKFLHMATKSNPSILDIFLSPVEEITPEGTKLMGLFDDVWSTHHAYNAFRGYAKSQEKRMNNKTIDDIRYRKYCVAYLRTIYNAVQLFKYGSYNINIKQAEERVRDLLLGVQHQKTDPMEALTMAKEYEKQLDSLYESTPEKQVNWDRVNKFLLGIRKSNW